MPVAGSTTTPERVPHLAIITTCAIGGTLLQSLDQTIAEEDHLVPLGLVERPTIRATYGQSHARQRTAGMLISKTS
jgi:hypothetical protein